MPLIWTEPVEQKKTQYTEEELERYGKRGARITDKGQLESEDGQLIIPENAQWKLLKDLHQSFHLVQTALTIWLLVCLQVKM